MRNIPLSQLHVFLDFDAFDKIIELDPQSGLLSSLAEAGRASTVIVRSSMAIRDWRELAYDLTIYSENITYIV
jgi:hypothetical protein